jgi:two-component system, chemotaxis family, chemotaxis protein CheY
MPSATAPTVLLVEDDRELREVMAEALELEGFAVRTAVDGLDALAQAAGAPPPDALVMDLLMPRLSGEGMLARLREDPAWRDVPVVVMTGTPPSRYGTVPAAAVLEKPVNYLQLARVLRRLCGKEQGPG